MDITAIQSAITSLKVGMDLIKGIRETENANEVPGKVIELQEALWEAYNNAISATTAQFELLDRVRALEEQLKAFNDWDEQGPRYTLVCPWGNAAQVYALLKARSAGDAAHFLCPNCFHKKQRVILNQVVATPNNYVSLACPSCKARIDTSYRGIAAPEYAEDYERATT